MSQAHSIRFLSDTRAVIVDKLVWLAILLLPITGLQGLALWEIWGSASIYVSSRRRTHFTTPAAQDIVLREPSSSSRHALSRGSPSPARPTSRALRPPRFTDGPIQQASIVLRHRLGFAIAVACLDLSYPRQHRRLFLAPLVLAIIACACSPSRARIMVSLLPARPSILDHRTFSYRCERAGAHARPPISLAFEAPDMSYFTGFACPWLLLAYRLKVSASSAWSTRALAAVPLALCLIMLLLTNSRTGILMLAGLLGAELIFWFSLRFLRLRAVALVLIFVLLAVAAAVPLILLHGGAPSNADDISTISRLALLSTQIAMFLHNPFFGVGLGQFGFHAEPLLPAWAWDSYGILNWFEKQGASAELQRIQAAVPSLDLSDLRSGTAPGAGAVARVVQAAPQLPARSPLLYLNAAVFANAVGLTLGGLSNDAFRRPEPGSSLPSRCFTPVGRRNEPKAGAS